ncbi:MAG: hypothetical protein P4M05_33575 [Bradyrhizobium sp.]|nr:hypothetical protein [Bradyrhizobium sp.]
MTVDDRKARSTLERLVDLSVEDILDASDADILAEFQQTHGDPAKNAADMRALFEKSLVVMNKSKLKAAREGLAASKIGQPNARVLNIRDARERLRRTLAACPPEMKLTLAARKESELSDADVVGMLQDFEELGVLPPDEST